MIYTAAILSQTINGDVTKSFFKALVYMTITRFFGDISATNTYIQDHSILKEPYSYN